MNAEKDLLRTRLNGLVLARPLFLIPLLGLFILFHFNSIQNTRTLSMLFFLMGATGGLTVLYALLIPRTKKLHTLVWVQLVGDLFIITLLTGVTGNVESPFSILFIVNIVLSALFFPQGGGVLTATTAIFLLSGSLVPAEGLGLSWIKPLSGTVPTDFVRRETFYRLFLHILAFYSTGIVSSRFFRKMREEEMKFTRLRRLNEDIVRNIPSGLVTTDREGRILLFNNAASHIMGIAQEEAFGAIWWDLFAWEELRRRAHDLIAVGVPQRFEGSLAKRDGRPCVLGVTLSCLRNDRGEVAGLIGIFQDLTEIKKLEEEMYHKRRLAALGEMAAGMAHEIRNPLASISGSVQLLKNELVLSGEYQPLMEIALNETQRLNNIITEFILYAKPFPPRRRFLNLRDLLSESVELLKNTNFAKGIQIHLSCSPASISLWVDPDQIKQVFWNLAINAFQAMSEGGTLTIRVTLQDKEQSQENQVEICFCDTGVGIPPENHRKIFDPFFTTKSAGSGLGLPIVQRIVEQHRGTIAVESGSAGTAFRIVLPQGESDEERSFDNAPTYGESSVVPWKSF